MSKKYYKIIISGRVQGVNFRYTAKTYADQLGLYGYAKNQSDGSVCIEIEGDESKNHRYQNWLRKQNIFKIDHIDILEGPIKGFRDFQIY